ncbi:acyltransferase family protein [Polynucleobacter sp. AP-Latsch-80-C2]|jgi:peptidoglycan/LPS O-acetylase OafA/YrhL|uniref:acyltransferase family protein n=1 Tax=Polynucleobacter sp. AP-Latsch-80-C2 TaxID=2576931 RepID=UPI001C0D7495|nr:acyltransferase family protein [Polynucleobacter sp. AP-Latsch-80-C2]MBU3623181.1 acyltransferase [Polynucleobacter sp. AP-Latsch-80-C2]
MNNTHNQDLRDKTAAYSAGGHAHPQYRPDIDGLRALAVLLVVLFHAFPQVLPGGFIGVDVFFVISGFLITSILLASLDAQRFSFLDFYARRIRRIFPALILVLAFALILGWFAFFPDEYRLLGQHTVASASFLQNFNLLSEIGYFDEAADTKPFLHLWSLAIEEQFYLLWPLLLWLTYKVKAKPIWCIALVGLGSFGLCLYFTINDPTWAFFSPITRFWELLMGGALAYYAPAITKRQERSQNDFSWLSAIGLLLIVGGAGCLNASFAFPGYFALLPTFGAALIIASSAHSPINRALFSNRAMVALGKISYPLYLWHWVLLSFIRITESGEVSPLIRWLALSTSLILATLTYHLLEKPIQAPRYAKAKTIALILGMLIIAGIGHNIYQRDGLAFRSNAFAKYESTFKDPLLGDQSTLQNGVIKGFTCDHHGPSCEPLDKKQSQLLLWGDSHASMLYEGLKKSLPASWHLLLVSSPGCKPALVTQLQDNPSNCNISNAFATEQLQKFPLHTVLLAQRDEWDPSVSNPLYEQLIAMGVKKVLYLGKTPEWNAKLPKIVARQSWHHIPQYSQAGLNLKALQLNTIAKQQFESTPQKQYIDLIDFLCNTDGCLVYFGDDLKTGISSYDTNHLSPQAAEIVAKQLLIPYLQ